MILIDSGTAVAISPIMVRPRDFHHERLIYGFARACCIVIKGTADRDRIIIAGVNMRKIPGGVCFAEIVRVSEILFQILPAIS